MILERLNTEFTKEKVAYELHRRELSERVSRWAMITRKMNKEPSHDSPTDFTELIGYVERLPLQIVSSTEYLSNIVLLLSSRKGREVEEAVGALGNIAVDRIVVVSSALGDTAGRRACVLAGAVPALVRLLSSSKGRETERAAEALGNIAMGDPACAAACVSGGAVPALVSLLSSSKGREAQEAAWALGSIASGDVACKAACVSEGAVPALVSLM
jgi:hypothetical protein